MCLFDRTGKFSRIVVVVGLEAASFGTSDFSKGIGSFKKTPLITGGRFVPRQSGIETEERHLRPDVDGVQHAGAILWWWCGMKSRC